MNIEEPLHLCLALTIDESKEMLTLLNRAVNTLEPADWPSWLQAYFDALEKFAK